MHTQVLSNMYISLNPECTPQCELGHIEKRTSMGNTQQYAAGCCDLPRTSTVRSGRLLTTWYTHDLPLAGHFTIVLMYLYVHYVHTYINIIAKLRTCRPMYVCRPIYAGMHVYVPCTIYVGLLYTVCMCMPM